MKKIIKFYLVVILVFVCSLAIPFQSNAASQKSQVKKVINAYLKNLKAVNGKEGKYVWANENEEDNSISLDKNNEFFKLVRAQNKKYLKYSVKSIKVKGNKAKVKVAVRYRSFRKPMVAAIVDLFLYAFGADELSDEETYYLLGKFISSEAKTYKPKTKKTQGYVYLSKRNGKWKVESVTECIGNAFYLDYYKALGDANKIFED